MSALSYREAIRLVIVRYCNCDLTNDMSNYPLDISSYYTGTATMVMPRGVAVFTVHNNEPQRWELLRFQGQQDHMITGSQDNGFLTKSTLMERAAAVDVMT